MICTNDLDRSFVKLKWWILLVVIEPKDGVDGYYIAIEDNGTNLAGYSGFNKIFDGNSAKDIDVHTTLEETFGIFECI